MEISVKHGNRAPVKITLSDAASLSELMEKAAEEFGICEAHQRLIFRGTTLSDPTASLSSYNVKHNAKVLLVNSQPLKRPEPPRLDPALIPKPSIDFGSCTPIVIRGERLTVPPHSQIIANGPPDGALPGNNCAADCLPVDPLCIRDDSGDPVRLSFGDEALVIESLSTSKRTPYNEIASFVIHPIPGYEQQYIAIALHSRDIKQWLYFVPRQYRRIIESFIQRS